MSFTLAIKNEILDKDFSPEEAFDFIRGLVAASGIENSEKTKLHINTKSIYENIITILKGIEMHFLETSDNMNTIIIDLIKKNQSVKFPDFFFAGLFLGGGSVSDKDSSSYHLELQFHTSANAEKLQKLFSNYGFSFRLIQRRKKFVLYIKKQTLITDFLRSIHAPNSALDFEQARIERDYMNAINRYSNLDIYNQSKLAKASNAFIDLYSYVLEHSLEHMFRNEELNFFEMKKSNLYSSLSELTQMYNDKYKTKKTRAGLNHWIYKLKDVVRKEGNYE